MLKPVLAAGLLALTAACAVTEAPDTPPAPADVPLYPNETPQIRALVNQFAATYDVPPPLIHKVIQRESDYRPNARNGPYYGMMQILPATARGMGFAGSNSDLLEAETNLTWAVKYLKGAWMVSDGSLDDAVMWYARGYYYEAKNKCLLVETGLNPRETAKHCR